MKRTTRRRNYKKRNKTSKGGNTKVHLIVRKSNIQPPPKDEKPKLFYELLFERPAFYPNNLFGYANIQRDAVDEALSWLHLEDVPERDDISGEEIKKIDTKVYEEKFEYGNTIDSETMERYKNMVAKKNKRDDTKTKITEVLTAKIAKEKEKEEKEKEEKEQLAKENAEKERLAKENAEKVKVSNDVYYKILYDTTGELTRLPNNIYEKLKQIDIMMFGNKHGFANYKRVSRNTKTIVTTIKDVNDKWDQGMKILEDAGYIVIDDKLQKK